MLSDLLMSEIKVNIHWSAEIIVVDTLQYDTRIEIVASLSVTWVQLACYRSQESALWNTVPISTLPLYTEATVVPCNTVPFSA